MLLQYSLELWVQFNVISFVTSFSLLNSQSKPISCPQNTFQHLQTPFTYFPSLFAILIEGYVLALCCAVSFVWLTFCKATCIVPFVAIYIYCICRCTFFLHVVLLPGNGQLTSYITHFKYRLFRYRTLCQDKFSNANIVFSLSLYLYEQSLCPKFILCNTKKRISVTKQFYCCSCVSVTAKWLSELVAVEHV